MNLKATDRWAVLSPGRTGSKVIVDCIRAAYVSAGIPLSYIAPDEAPFTVNGGGILHSHDYSIYNTLREEDYTIVISCRDMIDATVSWCIREHIGIWHLYTSEEFRSVRIVPFVLDMQKFYQYYDTAMIFYQRMAVDIKQHYSKVKIIDYSEFEGDSSMIYELLDLPTPDEEKIATPIKNPGSPKSWISNWHDIQNELYRLRRVPEILL